MATKAKQPETPAPPTGGDPMGMGELEKVRSILFGEQIRSHEAQLALAEQRLNGQIDTLRSDMMERFQAMDEALNALASRFDERLSGEGAERAGSDAERRAEIADVGSRLEAAEQALAQKLDAAVDEHRAALQARSDALMEALKTQVEELTRHLKHSHSELNTNKIDRVQLAAFMNQLADQLSSDGSNGERA